ncbi:MAG: hypothetical protein IH914_10880 [candidate division Zixibacteria bacterium]|nr:hypothetical protein [candidate division Zixibacteria bacterium]
MSQFRWNNVSAEVFQFTDKGLILAPACQPGNGLQSGARAAGRERLSWTLVVRWNISQTI